MTGVHFKIWRQNGSTYDLVGEENVLSKISPESTNLITLDSSIAALEGDFIGWGLEGPAYNTFYAGGSGKIYYLNDEADNSNFDWESETPVSLDIATRVYMQAPLMIGIGDSLMSGYADHNSFIQSEDVTDIEHQIMYQLSQLNSDIVYQNMGRGGNNSTQVASRFTADVLNLKPGHVIILVGVNDLAQSVSKATYIANMTTILNACETNSIYPIVVKILPWSNGSNANMQLRDDWMADLEDLTETIDGCVFVDCDSAIGEFRTGGDAENLWNIQSVYNGDGTHLNEEGYAKIAETIYAAL